jgi:hypothetical protein
MQERLYCMEQRAGIVSSPLPPYVPPRDPMQLYDEACVAFADEASSCRRGKSTAPPEDEDYIQEDDADMEMMTMMMVMTRTTMMASLLLSCVKVPSLVLAN